MPWRKTTFCPLINQIKVKVSLTQMAVRYTLVSIIIFLFYQLLLLLFLYQAEIRWGEGSIHFFEEKYTSIPVSPCTRNDSNLTLMGLTYATMRCCKRWVPELQSPSQVHCCSTNQAPPAGTCPGNSSLQPGHNSLLITWRLILFLFKMGANHLINEIKMSLEQKRWKHHTDHLFVVRPMATLLSFETPKQMAEASPSRWELSTGSKDSEENTLDNNKTACKLWLKR